MITHAPDCQAAFDARQAEIAAWKERWPQHCDDCQGWGGHGYSYDPSPAGVSLGSGSMWEFEPCAVCVEQGRCPRCGQPAWDSETGDGSTPCPHCQWDPTKPDGCPPSPECGCWIVAECPPPDWESKSLTADDALWYF